MGEAEARADRRRDDYVLTPDPERVDVDQVPAWLATESYWAQGRERGLVARSVSGSRPYSVFAAHEVYRRCGFVPVEGSDRWMELDGRVAR